MLYRSTFLLIIVLSIAAWSLITAAPAAPQASLTTVTTALPAFLQPASSQTVAAPPPGSGPALVVGIGTSVIPPGPPFGGFCSVNDPAGGSCSAFQQNERCSAINGNNNICSATDFRGPASTTCSSFGVRAACSVLPPSNPAQADSFCSASPVLGSPGHQCSAVGQARRQLCSAKGQGQDICSSVGQGFVGYLCSVLNPGAAVRSFCSTKSIQPVIAKGCSTHPLSAAPEECSVILGGKGICTSFGAADPASCSALGPNGHCSVIGGAPGNRCVQ